MIVRCTLTGSVNALPGAALRDTVLQRDVRTVLLGGVGSQIDACEDECKKPKAQTTRWKRSQRLK